MHAQVHRWFDQLEFHQQEPSIRTTDQVAACINGGGSDQRKNPIGAFDLLTMRGDRRDPCAMFFLDAETTRLWHHCEWHG